jgi:glycosyltransferase involved in cell wall biosynthesis
MDSYLCKTGHNFYCLQFLPQNNPFKLKHWKTTYRPVPPNYTLLDPKKGDGQIPPDLDIDIVLSQHRWGQFQIMDQIAKKFNIPHICIEHTAPIPQWDSNYLNQVKSMRADINTFISEWSRERWGWKPEEALVVHHGIDLETFKSSSEKKEMRIGACVNDWINRDVFCGFNLWKESTKDLPVAVIGDTPGLSKPAQSLEALVEFYNSNHIFINTSLVSPIPCSLLEAAACECAIVSTPHCLIKDVFTHGHDAYLADNPTDIRKYLNLLLKDKKECYRIGSNARKTVAEKFNLDKFVQNWNNIFVEAVREPKLKTPHRFLEN